MIGAAGDVDPSPILDAVAMPTRALSLPDPRVAAAQQKRADARAAMRRELAGPSNDEPPRRERIVRRRRD